MPTPTPDSTSCYNCGTDPVDMGSSEVDDNGHLLCEDCAKAYRHRGLVHCPACGIPTLEDADDLTVEEMLCDRCHYFYREK